MTIGKGQRRGRGRIRGVSFHRKVTFNAFCVAVVADVAVVIAAGLSQQQRTRVNWRRGDRFNLLVANRPVPPVTASILFCFRFLF